MSVASTSRFEKAYSLVMRNEGGYVHDPDDLGGETYKGIARRFHPRWRGWRKIDTAKNKKGFPKILDKNESLQRQVKEFYKKYYWDVVGSDDISDYDLAEELFDTAVNFGTRRTVRLLQRAVNLLNRNERNYLDIIEDGIFGKNSLQAVKKAIRLDRSSKYIIKIINSLQAGHYISRMEETPVQEKYARGWLNRA